MCFGICLVSLLVCWWLFVVDTFDSMKTLVMEVFRQSCPITQALSTCQPCFLSRAFVYTSFGLKLLAASSSSPEKAKMRGERNLTSPSFSWRSSTHGFGTSCRCPMRPFATSHVGSHRSQHVHCVVGLNIDRTLAFLAPLLHHAQLENGSTFLTLYTDALRFVKRSTAT